MSLTGQSATQSSTSNSAPASRAIDGATSGQWGDGTCTHTSGSETPWWQVTLPAGYTITSVKIYNRVDCCGDRIVNTKVKVDNYECGKVSSSGSTIDVACANAPTTTVSSVLRLYKEAGRSGCLVFPLLRGMY